jgi:chloramphenicol 3-O-phosphotransferase
VPRGLADVVHAFGAYDRTVGTAAMTTEACVAEVIAGLAACAKQI